MAPEQLTLAGFDGVAALLGFDQVRRTQLDATSWIDYVPSFLAGHGQLYEQLRSQTRFRNERRVMYEREVEVPRLYASLPDDGAIPTLLGQARQLIAHRYGVANGFERIGVALYRGGADSVAFHRDHMPRDRETLVAIVSLGTPRRMLVRRYGGGASRAFSLGWGDLLVMGGMCQAHWEHGIPKVAHAEPRMSCVMRHVYDAEAPHAR